MLINTYTGQGLVPSRRPEFAWSDAIKLAPGYYQQGTVLAEYTLGAAANAVQTVTVTGTPTGGSIGYLRFQEYQTPVLAHNVTAAAMQAALEALPNIGAGNVTVALDTNVYTITFVDELAAQLQPALVLIGTALTGGTDPAAAVAVVTAGRAAGLYYGAYNDSLSNGLQVAKGLLKSNTTVNTKGQHQSGNVFFNLQNNDYTAIAWFGGIFATGDGTSLLLPGLDAAGVADMGRVLFGSTLTSAATEIVTGC